MNTSKKIISLLMCMLMVLTMVPIMPGAVRKAHAADAVVYEITNLNLGAVPNTYPDMTVNCNDESVRVEVRWYDYSTGGMPTILTKLDKFKVGMDLKCLVAIYAKDGTIPTGAEVTINGEAYSISASGTDYLDVIIPIGVVSDVSADVIEVTGLDLNPVVGQVPDTTAECDKEYVTMVIVEWYDFKDATDNSNAVKITGNINVGMDVKCKVTVFSATGAIPVNATATINGGAYGFVRESGNIMSCFIPFGVMTPQVPETIEITGLDLDVSANEVLDTAVSANTDAVTCEVQWTDKNIGDKLTKAEYCSTPKMRLEIRPVEGYEFTSEPKLKVNGTLVDATRLSDSNGPFLVYIKEFSQIVPPADKVIKEVGISGSDYERENLVIGKAPVLDYTCLDDRVNFACWYEDDITGNKITKFAAGQQVRLKFEITPKDGYVFPYDEEVTVYVNGDDVFVHYNSTFRKVVASIPYGVLKYDDIKSLNITDYTKPSPNHAPDAEFGLSDTNVASATFAWTDSNGNPVTKFEAGKTYTCTATFVGKSGHGFSSVANIQLMYKGIPYLTFNKNNYVLTDYNNKLVATATYTIPADAVEEHTWDAGQVTKAATCTATGTKTYKCAGCGTTKTETIAKIKSVTLSTTNYIYNGKNKTPKVTVKDANGKTLVKNTDYKLTVASKRSGIGRYTVKVTFIGNYSGSKNVFFYIKTGKPATVKSASQTTSSVKLSWSAVPGASGYTVYRYSPSKKAYVKAGTTEGTSFTVKSLYAGTKYTFRVVSYGKTTAGKVYDSDSYALLKTATKTKTPELTKVTASATKGKAYVYHSNVSGETGYTVYYSTKKDSGFKKYANFKADTTRCDITGLTSGKTYYFKVRTYIKTDSGYVYSAWSAVKSVKVK